MDDLPPEISGRVRERIRKDLLRIHTRRVEGAGLMESLRGAYDVFVSRLEKAGWRFSDELVKETIPFWVFQFARSRGWLPESVPPADLRAGVKNMLSGCIVRALPLTRSSDAVRR